MFCGGLVWFCHCLFVGWGFVGWLGFLGVQMKKHKDTDEQFKTKQKTQCQLKQSKSDHLCFQQPSPKVSSHPPASQM